MHYIQKHILDELRTGEAIRYAQLNREGVESGHFRYHLTELIKGGYIDQLERGLYQLSLKGQHFVDTLSGQRIKPNPMPKVITYTLLMDGDKVILQEKQKQPYLGLINMIGGKLHEGETAEKAAIREVLEKTGLIINDPKLVGIYEVLIRKGGNLLTHTIAYVFTADVNAAEFTLPSLRAVANTEVQNLPNLAPDFLPIFNQVCGTKTIQVGAIEADAS